jgi:spermidine synthase
VLLSYLPIALVPASLLFRKGKYQTIANNLPGQGVLICQAEKQKRITTILEHVASFFKQRGHFVKMVPYSLLL